MNDFVAFWAILVPTLVSGPAAFNIGAISLPITERFIDKIWLRRPKDGSYEGLVSRIRITIKMCRFRASLPLLHCFVGLLGILLLLQMNADIPSGFIIFVYLFGFWILPLTNQSTYFDETLPQFNLMTAVAAAKRLVEVAPVETQQKVLAWMSSFSESRIKIAAINGYMEKTDVWARNSLQTLALSNDSLVKAAAEEAFLLVSGVIKGNGIPSVLPLEGLCKAYQVNLDQIPGLQSSEVLKRYEKARIGVDLERLANQIDDIIYAQLSLREAYPNVYCKECLSWAEEESFREWKWVRCKRCLDVPHLISGVRAVIGEIGGQQDWNLENEILRIKMWDNAQRKAVNAEIGALRIFAGKEFDYDWAISAVVQKIQNQVETREGQIMVKINGELHLSQNTKRLLRSLDPTVKLD